MAKSSLDSVLGGRNLENIIRLLHDDGIEYIEETVGGMSLLERQIFFVNCIKVIDKSYYDHSLQCRAEKRVRTCILFSEGLISDPLKAYITK